MLKPATPAAIAHLTLPGWSVSPAYHGEAHRLVANCCDRWQRGSDLDLSPRRLEGEG